LEQPGCTAANASCITQQQPQDYTDDGRVRLQRQQQIVKQQILLMAENRQRTGSTPTAASAGDVHNIPHGSTQHLQGQPRRNSKALDAERKKARGNTCSKHRQNTNSCKRAISCEAKALGATDYTHTCTKQMQIEGIADEMALLTLNVTSSTSFLADCQTVAKQH